MAPILSRLSSLGGGGTGGFSFGKKQVASAAAGLTLRVKLWGAGGNGGLAGGWSYGAAAGGGGFVSATFSLPRIYQGTNLILQVGQQGFGVGTPFQRGFGGGCTADTGGPDNRYGGGGGGYTGIFLASVSQGNALAIAGGGGGGGSSRAGEGNVGGAGGGTTGADGTAAYDSSGFAGKGGTQSAGGFQPYDPAPQSAGALQGGAARTNNYGGGGGGGYYGGSGGGYNEPNTMAGGGGGSGYVNPSFVSGPFTNAQGSGQTSGGSTDPQWPGSVGTGGPSNNGTGQHGFARITYNGVETTYSYTGSNVTITL
jgi:hypothetical protein